MRKIGLKYEERKAVCGLLFVLSGVIFFGIFYIWPIVQTIYTSFCRWSIIGTSRWIGLKNFVKLLSSEGFYNSLRASLYYSFGTAIPLWFIGLSVAVLFHRIPAGKRGYLTLFYIPVVIPLIAWSILWMIMYHPTFGLLTIITVPLGFINIPWLTSKHLAMPSMIILSIWRGIPYYGVIYLAGLAAIPEQYIEAAQVEGANNRQVFLYITLPLLKPMITYVVIISLINAFQIFDIFYAMTGGGPGSRTEVMPYFIYKSAFHDLKMGYTCAASVIFFFLILTLSFIILRTLKMGKE